MADRVGIKDVATAAGVSITTVSHALSGKGRLPETTRRRVQRIAEELEYSPDVSARKLGGGKSGLLALAVSQVSDLEFQLGDFDYFVSLIRAATMASIERGYSLTITPTGGGQSALEKIPADGGVVVDPVRDDPSVSYLRRSGIPVVTTGQLPGQQEAGYWVDNDYIDGVKKVLDHLHQAGARRIGLVAPRGFTSYIADVRRGYSQWCEEHDVEEIIGSAPSVTEEGGFSAASRLLDRDDPPDAIYASLDRIAIGVLLAANARGVEVPDDLLVAACTDTVAAQAAKPPLTTLGVNPERIGREAITMLINLVEGEEVKEPHKVVPTYLIERESTIGRGSHAISAEAGETGLKETG